MHMIEQSATENLLLKPCWFMAAELQPVFSQYTEQLSCNMFESNHFGLQKDYGPLDDDPCFRLIVNRLLTSQLIQSSKGIITSMKQKT